MAYVQQAMIHLQIGNVQQGLALFEDLSKKFGDDADVCNCYGQVVMSSYHILSSHATRF